MKQFPTKTERHYYQVNLYEKIASHLQDLGFDLDNVKREDIATVDEFHVRGAQVSKELAETVEIRGSKVLDVGCGIGGPCRMLADEYGCDVTGIDLSEEYTRTASKLSELVGLSSKIKFIHGDATNLPFEEMVFDVVWTQHVQMNINDKLKFYSEIERVLVDKGVFLYYDILKTGNENINYPVPWADEQQISFLATENEIEKILRDLNLKKIKVKDQTHNGILFFEKMIDRIQKFGPPKIGLNLLMGESTQTKIVNLLSGLKEGKLMLQSGVYKKV
ncbi:class I SAM-dependent methyltransferase [Ascidiimonas sp. W6]|uniref:class I SAM-dependent methyltransferase n=1 Tax=Ascidiimonas meishanensis TaxID=3128903 RepID=UPI0030EF3F7C